MIVLLLVLGIPFVQAQTASDLIYLPSPQTEAILVIDPAEAAVTETIELESRPVELVVHPDTGIVYVITQDDSTLIIIDDTTITDTIDLDNAPSSINLDAEANLLIVEFDDTGESLQWDAATLEPVTDTSSADMPTPDAVSELLLPSYPLCPLNADAARETFQTNLTPGLIDLQCRILAEDGEFIQPAAEIGIEDVLELGVIHAVELFSPSGVNAAQIDICLHGSGHIIYLDAEGQPRVPEYVRGTARSGYTCTQLQGLGTIILVE